MNLICDVSSMLMKQNAQGQTLIFPWAPFGKGRVIGDTRLKRRVRQTVNGFVVLNFAIILGTLAIDLRSEWRDTPEVMLGALIVSAVLARLLVWRLLAGTQIASDRFAMRDLCAGRARTLSGFTLGLLFVIGLLMAFGGVWLFFFAAHWTARAAGLLGAAFFGVAADSLLCSLRIGASIDRQ